MKIVIRNGYRIDVSEVYPAYWQAVDDNTYDCDCDEYGFFSLGPVGEGPTEEAAIADLIEQLEDDDGHA